MESVDSVAKDVVSSVMTAFADTTVNTPLATIICCKALRRVSCCDLFTEQSSSSNASRQLTNWWWWLCCVLVVDENATATIGSSRPHRKRIMVGGVGLG